MSLLSPYDIASRKLGAALNVPIQVCTEIDNPISSWVDAYAAAMTPPYTDKRLIPGLSETPTDQGLKKLLASLYDNAMLYAWANIWLVQDSLFSGLCLPVTGPRLRPHLTHIGEDLRMSACHSIALTEFFAASAQDSELDAELWKRFNHAGLIGHSANDVRDELLRFFAVRAAKKFGFSYANVGRVMLQIRPEDHQTQRQFKVFKDPDNRASAEFVAVVLSEVGFDLSVSQSGKAARDVLVWFSNARTKSPGERWISERERLESIHSARVLEVLSSWVLERPSKRYFVSKPYRDDLFYLLWKSASWYMQLDPRGTAT